MKHRKTFGLAAVAAMALTAFAASSASATALYNGTTKMGFGSTFDFSLKSGTKATLTDTEGHALDECTSSTIKATITNAGGSTLSVGAEIDEVVDFPGEKLTFGLTWGNCTVPTATVQVGSLEFSYTSGTKALVEAALETAVTINTILFGSCVYSMDLWSDVGTLTTLVSGAATLDVNAVLKKTSGSGIACPETTKWVATYVGTEPSNLRVETS